MEIQATSTPEHGDEKSASLQRLPYRTPTLIEYGSVAKLTQGTSITANGDGGHLMMV